MKLRAHFNSFLTIAFLSTCAICTAQGNKPRLINLGTHPPIIAMWTDCGYGRYHAPNLRFAIWNDGRYLVAPGKYKWGSVLQEGTISADRVALLKKQISDTGIFDLTSVDYVIPDAACARLIVNFGLRRQTLNSSMFAEQLAVADYQPDSITRKPDACWTAINRLVVASQPKNGKPVNGTFEAVPASWYVKSNR